jgi:hypothetical protein
VIGPEARGGGSWIGTWVLFRIIHITSAALWYGAALYYSGFTGPTILAAGPDAGRLFTHLVRERRAVIFFLTVSTSTVAAGAFLYWRDSGGLDTDWMQTGFGTGLTVGAVAGLISWLLVVLILAPTSYRLVALGERIARTEGPASREDMASMEVLRSRLNSFAIVNIVSLTVAILAMAMARYLNFWILDAASLKRRRSLPSVSSLKPGMQDTSKGNRRTQEPLREGLRFEWRGRRRSAQEVSTRRAW